MKATICLLPSALGYPEGGGQLWVYLNWALGLRALGCDVIWLELVWPNYAVEDVRSKLLSLRGQLAQYGLAEHLAIGSMSGDKLPEELCDGCLNLDDAAEADLLLDLQYECAPETLRRFRRTALVDIDPGLLQIWHTNGQVKFAPHDVYFSIGETVGQSGARFPDCGVQWHYTPPPVFLPAWPVVQAENGAAYTTTAHWYYGEMEWNGQIFNNDKRTSFLEFLDLPSQSRVRVELALCLGDNVKEQQFWERHGWRICNSWDVSSTAADYQQYIRQSYGEFSCAKPSCMRLQNAWISDRTLCYLASGKPAIVQHTGPSRFLPDAEGLFRFRTVAEALSAFETVQGDYENQCALARSFAENFCDATKVVQGILELALQ
jgi:hypothetical protein